MKEHLYQVKVNGVWTTVSETIFRSWNGQRKMNGHAFHGPVFYYLSHQVSRPAIQKKTA